MAEMKSQPNWRRHAAASLMPAILAMAYHSLVGSSGPVKQRVFAQWAVARISGRCRTIPERAALRRRPAARPGSGWPRSSGSRKKLAGRGRIGQDPADLRRGQEHRMRPLSLHPGLDLVLAQQVNHGPRRRSGRRKPRAPAAARAPNHQAPMAADQDALARQGTGSPADRSCRRPARHDPHPSLTHADAPFPRRRRSDRPAPSRRPGRQRACAGPAEPRALVGSPNRRSTSVGRK